MKVVIFVFVLITSLGAFGASSQCLGLFQKTEAPTSGINEDDIRRISGLLEELLSAIKAHNSGGPFASNEIAINFSRLAEGRQLLKQTDPVLAAYDLLKPNGGLCATTSVVNGLWAALVPAHVSSQLRPQIYELTNGLVQEYSKNYTDARYGAFPKLVSSLLVMGLQQVLGEFTHVLGNKSYSTREIAAVESMLENNFAAHKNALVFATVSPSANSHMFGAHRAHAIVILGIDVHKKLVYISDPNNPNVISPQNYSVDGVGRMQFYVPSTYGSQIVDFTNATAFHEI